MTAAAKHPGHSIEDQLLRMLTPEERAGAERIAAALSPNASIDDAEGDAWLARAYAAADAMTDADRQRHLLRCDYSAFRDGEKWGVIGSNGVTDRGFASEREAENSILVGLGLFDDI